MVTRDITVLITGGSTGIGLATAKALAARGAYVVLAARSRPKLEAARAVVTDAAKVAGAGGRAETFEVDVTDPDAVRRLVDAVAHAAGGLDHVVTAAGEQAIDAPARELPLATARRIFEVKYWGQYHAAVAAAPHIRPGGSITLFSAWLARKPTAGFPTYAAVDGAVEALARVLAQEFAPTRVNVVSPGVIDTPLYANLPDEARRAVFAGVADQLPLKRVGTAEDCAHAVQYLIESPYSTGAVVDVDGGWR